MTTAHTAQSATKPETSPVVAALTEALGEAAVDARPETLIAAGGDLTEQAPGAPLCVAYATSRADVERIVAIARDTRTPIAPRVANTNVGALAVPANGAIVLDLSRMNRIIEVNVEEQYARLEPGVTFGQLNEYLTARQIPLDIGYPLAPTYAGIIPNFLMDGLANVSLRYGPTSQQLNGIEAVLATGEVLRTGSSAIGNHHWGRPPLPDFTSLFNAFYGTTGIVTEATVALWPRPIFRERVMVMAGDGNAAFAAVRAFARLGLLNDVGALSWPTARLLCGVEKPGPRTPEEPEYFVYTDFGGPTSAELKLKREALHACIAKLRREGYKLGATVTLEDLVTLVPAFAKFAKFPTTLDFLLEHSGGGLTWLGTYGPVTKLDEGAALGVRIMEKAGFAPIVVCRPMWGGHYAVLRFIITFDKRDDDEKKRVRACLEDLFDATFPLGYIPYKTPAWAVEKLKPHLGETWTRVLHDTRRVLDPCGIMNPGQWLARLEPLATPPQHGAAQHDATSPPPAPTAKPPRAKPVPVALETVSRPRSRKPSPATEEAPATEAPQKAAPKPMPVGLGTAKKNIASAIERAAAAKKR